MIGDEIARQSEVIPLKKKLHLGCGHKILEGFLNVDIAELPGVDKVCNLSQFPWPLPSDHFAEIRAVHLLEHLSDTIKIMEELWRVAEDRAQVVIRVPYWNSSDAIVDPTHVKTFHQRSFDFFDPEKKSCRERPYYSRARFTIEKIHYWRPLVFGRGWIRVTNPIIKAVMGFLATYLNNIICVLEFELRTVKKAVL